MNHRTFALRRSPCNIFLGILNGCHFACRRNRKSSETFVRQRRTSDHPIPPKQNRHHECGVCFDFPLILQCIFGFVTTGRSPYGEVRQSFPCRLKQSAFCRPKTCDTIVESGKTEKLAFGLLNHPIPPKQNRHHECGVCFVGCSEPFRCQLKVGLLQSQ